MFPFPCTARTISVPDICPPLLLEGDLDFSYVSGEWLACYEGQVSNYQRPPSSALLCLPQPYYVAPGRGEVEECTVQCSVYLPPKQIFPMHMYKIWLVQVNRFCFEACIWERPYIAVRIRAKLKGAGAGYRRDAWTLRNLMGWQ